MVGQVQKGKQKGSKEGSSPGTVKAVSRRVVRSGNPTTPPVLTSDGRKADMKRDDIPGEPTPGILLYPPKDGVSESPSVDVSSISPEEMDIGEDRESAVPEDTGSNTNPFSKIAGSIRGFFRGDRELKPHITKKAKEVQQQTSFVDDGLELMEKLDLGSGFVHVDIYLDPETSEYIYVPVDRKSVV